MSTSREPWPPIPGIPQPSKNLGDFFDQEGGSLQALYYLRRSNECHPQDPQTVHGSAFAYMELRDIELAQGQFQAVLKMKAPEELRGLARNGLREMAARELKARGAGKNAGLLSGWARWLFREKSLQEIQEIIY